jgi:hypothetical protein
MTIPLPISKYFSPFSPRQCFRTSSSSACS